MLQNDAPLIHFLDATYTLIHVRFALRKIVARISLLLKFTCCSVFCGTFSMVNLSSSNMRKFTCFVVYLVWHHSNSLCVAACFVLLLRLIEPQ
jgi:hypothetical protein